MTNTFDSLTTDKITALCGAKTAEKGRGLLTSHAVEAASVSVEKNKLTGLVQGTGKKPYHVNLFGSLAGLSGHCTCPVGFNCKHVAAIMYHQIMLNSGGSASDLAAQSNVADSITEVKEVDLWLATLIQQNKQSEVQSEKHEPGEELLLYEMRVTTEEGSPKKTAGNTAQRETTQVVIDVFKSRLLKRGGFGVEKPYSFAASLGLAYERWVTNLDKEVFALYDKRPVEPGKSLPHQPVKTLLLTGSYGSQLLEKVLQTGRCYLGNQRKTPLRHVEGKKLLISWEMDDRDHYHLCTRLDQLDEWVLVPTSPPWFLDQHNSRAGIIRAAPEPGILQTLQRVPPVPKERALAFSNAIASKVPELNLPLPVKPNVRIIDTVPKPHLILQSRDESNDVAMFYCTLLMSYDGCELPFRGFTVPVVVDANDHHGSKVTIHRRPEVEMSLSTEIAERFHGMRTSVPLDPTYYSVADWQPMLPDVSAVMGVWQQVVDGIPALQDAGWKVTIKPPFDVRISQIQKVQALIEEGEGGWFDMGFHITHEGQRFDLVPYVAAWIGEGAPARSLMIQSESGVFVEVPLELVQPIADTLLEMFENPAGASEIRISQARALTLDTLQDEWREHGIESAWKGGEELFALADRLENFQGIEAPDLPDSIHADLRPYQHDGIAWLNFLYEYNFNGILADDMGLGKTLQTLGFLELLRSRGKLKGPVLVVAPTSLLGNWSREVARFTPALTTRIWHGNDRKNTPLADTPVDIVITSYALVLRDQEMLGSMGFEFLVLDEAQAIKNPNAKITQAVKSLPITRRLCLTGTPLENHLHELWSQFDFLMPDLLGTSKHFGRYFRSPIENHGSAERQARLNRMIRPFVLRRKKEDVASELPPKTEIVREVVLEGRQAALYESIRASMESKVRHLISAQGLARSHISMLDALLKLRQACCHPQLVKLPSARKVEESAKTDLLISMLRELIDEGKKVLLFSQFTEMLALIETRVAAENIDYVKLTGRTRNRDEVIDSFQNGDVPLFLISLKAGGTGLNLTAADTVIHYDPWWNPAVENQASDRAHRIGQDKPVFVYKLITAGTVEEKIVKMQSKKQALADQTLNGSPTDTLKGLSPDDVLSLFAPLEEK